jgi:hypothetical protein
VIESDSKKNIQLIITDLYGQSKQITTSTLDEGIQKLTFDITAFHPEFYIASIVHENLKKSVKLMIQRNEQ